MVIKIADVGAFLEINSTISPSGFFKMIAGILSKCLTVFLLVANRFYDKTSLQANNTAVLEGAPIFGYWLRYSVNTINMRIGTLTISNLVNRVTD